MDMNTMSHEPLAIRVDSAAASTTSVPTAATDGILVPRGRRRSRVHLEIRKAVTAGTGTYSIGVFGYRSGLVTSSVTNGIETFTAVASSGAWYEIFDSETVTVSGTGENHSYLLDGATDFDRLDTVIAVNGGTNPTITTAFAFGGVD